MKNIMKIHQNTVRYFASNMRDVDNLKILAQTAQALWMKECQTKSRKKQRQVKDAGITDDPGG